MQITPLPDQYAFVFGSNLKGIHGKGAALTAAQRFGAVRGVGEGPMGNCYALPTQKTPYILMKLHEIIGPVERFMDFAHYRQDVIFQVTQVGCGLAGHNKHDIAPLFTGAPVNCWFDTAWYPILGANRTYWGHV